MTLVEPEEFVKMAREAGVKLVRRIFWNSELKCGCYGAVALYLKSPELLKTVFANYNDRTPGLLGLSWQQFKAIEAGFEGWPIGDYLDPEAYDYGAAIAKAAGLKERNL